MVVPITMAIASKPVNIDELTREELFGLFDDMCHQASRAKSKKGEAEKLLQWVRSVSGDIGFSGISGRVILAESKGLKLLVVKTPPDISMRCIADQASKIFSNGKLLKVVDFPDCELHDVRNIAWLRDRLPTSFSPRPENGVWWTIKRVL